MACDRYRLYEYDIDNNLHDTGNEFTASKDELEWMRFSLYGGSADRSNATMAYALMLVMFNKVFGFTYESGHRPIIIDSNTIDIIWRGNVWRLVKCPKR
jgi:hypothetical protein